MMKVCATGNDFLVVNHLHAPMKVPVYRPEKIAELCHRQNGFGADGFVILIPHAALDFEWHFYNSDGSEAEMCGNAARAVSLYYYRLTQKKIFSFLTKIGAVEAVIQVSPELQNSNQMDVVVRLPHWKKFEEDQGSPAGPFTFINSGVPHAVLDIPALNDLESLRKTAYQIKALPQFKEKGVNVTFKSLSSEPQKINSVTFERGVENFTLSCGTGAIAAAVAHAHGKTPFELTVQVPGGVLFVSADDKKVSLKGEARIIGSCEPGAIA